MYRLPFFATGRQLLISLQFASPPGLASGPLIEHTKQPIDSAPSNHPDSALSPTRVPAAHADSLSTLDNSRPARHAHSQKMATPRSLFPETSRPSHPRSLPAK